MRVPRRDRRVINDYRVVRTAPDCDQVVNKFIRSPADNELWHVGIYLEIWHAVERFFRSESNGIERRYPCHLTLGVGSSSIRFISVGSKRTRRILKGITIWRRTSVWCNLLTRVSRPQRKRPTG